MGNNSSFTMNKKINFEDMINAIENNDIIINTLSPELQHCLIYNTISIHKEVEIINSLLNTDKNKRIVIYGLNSADETIINKYNQLTSLGFYNVFVYTGGIFEWLLLQEVYGKTNFKTIGSENDILKYKGICLFNYLLK